MKYIFFLAALPAVFADCSHDNCYRAVVGTFRGSGTAAARMADCTRYTTTVYPSATTVSTTSGSVATTIQPAMPSSPTQPSYASACSGTQYISVCSCAMAPVKTSTAPTPTATVVVPIPITYKGTCYYGIYDSGVPCNGQADCDANARGSLCSDANSDYFF